MADTNAIAGESWWLKVGVLYDKSGFKAVGLGMLDLAKAANGVYDTFKKVVDVNSDLYNTSRYLNISSRDLQIWERAFRFIGSSADDARSSINSLNFVYDKLRLGLDSGAAEIGARLRLKPEDYLSFDRMMKALNRSYNEYFKGDIGTFRTLAEQLGLSKGALLLVTQSSGEYARTMQEAESIPVIPERQLKSARDLDKLFTRLSITWTNFKAQLVSATFPGLEKLLKYMEDVFKDPNTVKQAQALFDSLEKGFTDLATSENTRDLVESLRALGQIITGVGRFAGGVVHATEGAATAAGTAKGTIESAGIGVATKRFLKWFFGDQQMAKTSSYGLGMADYRKWVQPSQAQAGNTTVNATVNINGARDPQAVGEETADAINRLASENARAVERTALNTSI